MTLTIQDFRFIPDRIYLFSEQPSRLIIRNLGWKLHRFKSQAVSRSEVRKIEEKEKPIIDELDGVMSLPGETLELVFILKPGIYEFQCPIRGHQEMKGMFVVEAAGRERNRNLHYLPKSHRSTLKLGSGVAGSALNLESLVNFQGLP